ncbi:hypothetical protein EDB87DRAFT_1684513 [Lactarius vividus]|nr:hypothetical protein EDB87DRAFT_1684513 [Lactarius vividus]
MSGKRVVALPRLSSTSLVSVFSRFASRVPQATLVLSLSLLSLLPSANAAPTSDPSTASTATSPLDERADEPTHKSSSLSVPALLAILCVSLVVLLLGATLAYLYVRRRRVEQKRADHRKRTAQFQEMHRAGARPYHAGGVHVSLPLSATHGRRLAVVDCQCNRPSGIDSNLHAPSGAIEFLEDLFTGIEIEALVLEQLHVNAFIWLDSPIPRLPQFIGRTKES